MNTAEAELPRGGCTNCGKHAGETPSILKQRLVFDGAWLCKPCAKELNN